MPLMTRVAADLIGEGLAVETVPGWQTRGSASFAPAGVVCHWTAGPRSTRTRPSLSVVTYGRPGIPGPLCNIYLARDGTAVVVAAGRANHAGRGSWRGVVGNSGMYGIEAESAGDGDWTPAQRRAYPLVVAALLRGLDRDERWACGHAEWADPPGRKVDIRDWDMPRMRAQVAVILAPPTDDSPEDDMPTAQEVAAEVWQYVLANGRDAAGELASLRAEVASVPDGVLTAQVGSSGTLAEWVQAIRADNLRADAVTRAQLTAQGAALAVLAESQGVDPAVVLERVDTRVRDALARAVLTIPTT